MKCPKCGYLGFETTDRCRNCQYDFSLSPLNSDPDLTLRQEGAESNADFELQSMSRQPDSLAGGTLDLDRMFGGPEPEEPEPAGRAIPAAPPVVDTRHTEEVEPADEAMTMAAESAAEADTWMAPGDGTAAPDPDGLPFDDAPLLPPRPAKAPLAVRRATTEIPRNRPRTTRPVRMETPLAFDPAPAAFKDGEASALAGETMASLMQPPSLGARLAAGIIDVLLLAGIDAIILFLTLRIAGLQNTMADLRVIPPVPFAAFLALLAFGYVATFTVAGGQTIGKMLFNLRVIGDDGRPIDAAGGVLRAVGCMLVPATLGLSYVPALFSSDHRAVHDRLAGTRVVAE
ncbi:MAG: RDD family protein [Vicinamibacterales bacterium]